MKVLLDENVPHQLRTRLIGHEVFTVQYLGWFSLKDGSLLRTAQVADFNVFVTSDQNPTNRRIRRGAPSVSSSLRSRNGNISTDISGKSNLQSKTPSLSPCSSYSVNRPRRRLPDALAHTPLRLGEYLSCHRIPRIPERLALFQLAMRLDVPFDILLQLLELFTRWPPLPPRAIPYVNAL